ncbi:hypothetical protein [Micromonospora echinofusca]|uniref:Uncharacterized protein n=1 Tax=Micromonospora echinofusca TaxID=47858 RepID=A0ABS3VV34_MICEH|nr:hypothetical protein [Micromonospora echinofusca]MBO4208389.1 hypothetical protein [Micromonospora echinofusca]
MGRSTLLVGFGAGAVGPVPTVRHLVGAVATTYGLLALAVPGAVAPDRGRYRRQVCQ